MVVKNNELKSIHSQFVSENAKYKEISKMIWNKLLYCAGDNFLAMNEEERQQFYRTNIIHEDLGYDTKKNYYYAFSNVVEYIKINGHVVADDCEYNHKTKLVHIPRNKDNKTNDSDYDKLCEMISSLKKSMNLTKQEINLTEQEIKDFEQKLENLKNKFAELKNKFACDKYRLAKFERIRKDSKRVQEEVKEVLSY